MVSLGSAPLATAYDPFYDQMCTPRLPCVGAGTCVPTLACVPRGCDALVSCRAHVGPVGNECAVNQTIDGRTCAVYAGFDVDAGLGTRAGFMASSSNGSVEALNLFNTWTSPGVEADAAVVGLSTGRAFVYVYRSDILTEGPRGGPIGMVARYQNHTWTEVGATVGIHGGPTAIVAIELLDSVPESCYVRSTAGGAREFKCPSLAPLYTLIALP